MKAKKKFVGGIHEFDFSIKDKCEAVTNKKLQTVRLSKVEQIKEEINKMATKNIEARRLEREEVKVLQRLKAAFML